MATIPEMPRTNQDDVLKMMQTLSNWGRWGKDDQLGALNLITPQKSKEAAALVKGGPVHLPGAQCRQGAGRRVRSLRTSHGANGFDPGVGILRRRL